ncbi:hypothetical protein B0H15DRAFT_440991 [Mycena belliarum]|uniref:Uncharacterized protein n=1 Tax=Mycena belliarum TaxID=1033014 RepID=A0AAD6U2F3_9AGAR|nr:hypothetical protein B0H15DRAFT_440991 [Mycena belliae]
MSTPTPPSPTPTPKSLRARMGGVMRRTSSLLAVARPTTPAPGSTPVHPDEARRSSISKSLEGRKSNASLSSSSAAASTAAVPAPEPLPPVVSVSTDAASDPFLAPAAPDAPAPPTGGDVDTPANDPTPAPHPNGTHTSANGNGATHPAVKRLLPIAAQYQMYPSPIPESPAREAAASAEDVSETVAQQNEEAKGEREGKLGPSPLGGNVEVASPVEEEVTPRAMETVPQDAPAPASGAYVPPPLLGDVPNPGAFTDEPEDMHTAVPITAPVAAEEVSAAGDEAPAPDATMPEPDTAMSEPGPEDAYAYAPGAYTRTDAPAYAPAYFDLGGLARIAEASPGSAGTTVVAAEEQAARVAEPYPYDLRPAAQGEAGVWAGAGTGAGEAVAAAGPGGEPHDATQEQGAQAPGRDAQAPEPRQWADDGGWGREAREDAGFTMPVSDALPAPAMADTSDPFADPAPRAEDESVFVIPIAVVDPAPQDNDNVNEGNRERERERDVGGISSIPMPMLLGADLGAGAGPFGCVSAYSGVAW